MTSRIKSANSVKGPVLSVNNLETSKKVLVISMLAEGNSIRSIERMTGIHRDTIMRLGLRVGEACQRIVDEWMRGLSCKRIEADEIWRFIVGET